MSFLEQLINDIQLHLGVDVKKKGRTRNTVYARKLYAKIALDYGIGPTEAGEAIKFPHDLMIYHHKTFPNVRPKELNAYNQIVKMRNLPMNLIENSRALRQSPTMIRILNKLAKLTPTDLKYFETHKLNTFLDSLEKEKLFKFENNSN